MGEIIIFHKKFAERRQAERLDTSVSPQIAVILRIAQNNRYFFMLQYVELSRFAPGTGLF